MFIEQGQPLLIVFKWLNSTSYCTRFNISADLKVKVYYVIHRDSILLQLLLAFPTAIKLLITVPEYKSCDWSAQSFLPHLVYVDPNGVFHFLVGCATSPSLVDFEGVAWDHGNNSGGLDLY